MTSESGQDWTLHGHRGLWKTGRDGAAGCKIIGEHPPTTLRVKGQTDRKADRYEVDRQIDM